MEKQTTKVKILYSARQLFVNYGYAGTSMGKIGKLADVNHSLLFHHFGNKQQLWTAVKQSIVDEAKDDSPTLPDTDLPFAEFLKQLFERNIDFYHQHPDIIRLINWQRLELNTEKQRGIPFSSDMYSWIEAIEHYQNKQAIKQDIAPKYLALLILSLISSTALDLAVFFAYPGNQIDQQEYIDICLAQIIKITLL